MAVKVGRTEASDLQLLRAAFDADFDSKIDYKEFKKTMIGEDTDIASLLQAIRRVLQATKTDVDTILKRFDKDGSGSLDKTEFKEFLKSLNLRLTFLETEAIYDLLNYKQLPTLSREEIYNVLLIKGGSGVNTIKVIEGFK